MSLRRHYVFAASLTLRRYGDNVTPDAALRHADFDILHLRHVAAAMPPFTPRCHADE